MSDHSAFGKYTLLGRVGDGQMVEVWIAGVVREDGTRQSCVVKRVAPAYRDLSALGVYIQSEARGLAQLSHPGIVPMIESGEVDGLAYIAVELVDGVALQQLSALPNARKPTLNEVVDLGEQIARALAFAHAATAEGLVAGVIHRRLTPACVLIDREGQIKVADFAVVDASQDPLADISPRNDQLPYLAPEQLAPPSAQAGKVGPAADLFALGTVVLEAALGSRVFPNGVEDESDVAGHVRSLCAKVEGSSDELADLMVQLMSQEPQDRGDATSVADTFAGLRAGEAGTFASFMKSTVFAAMPSIDDLTDDLVLDDPPPSASTPAPSAFDIELPSVEITIDGLGEASVPGEQIKAMDRGPSYPTTGSLILEELTPDGESTLQPLPTFPPPSWDPLRAQGDAAPANDGVPDTLLDPVEKSTGQGQRQASLQDLPTLADAPISDLVPKTDDEPETLLERLPSDALSPVADGSEVKTLAEGDAIPLSKIVPGAEIEPLPTAAITPNEPTDAPEKPVTELVPPAPEPLPSAAISVNPPGLGTASVAPPQIVAGDPITPFPEAEEDEPEAQERPEPQEPTKVESFWLGPIGVKRLLSYEPYQRAIGLLPGGLAEAADPRKWEYYVIRGDRIGPRVIRKHLESRFYRDQVVTMLEGSKLLRHVPSMLDDARPLPEGAVEARGGTGAAVVDEEADAERYLRTHEQRQRRPRPRAQASVRSKFLQFFKKS